MFRNYHLRILVAVFVVSCHVVVCDVDPSDTVSILLEQLKIQAKQLDLSKTLIDGQTAQISVQREQIKYLQTLIDKPSHLSTGMTIFASVVCSILSFLAMFALKRFIACIMKRYASPEMPQTTSRLIDFASLSSVAVSPDQPSVSGCEGSTLMKSPTLSLRSDE